MKRTVFKLREHFKVPLPVIAFLFIKDYIYFRSALRTLEQAGILIGHSYQRLPSNQQLPKPQSFDFMIVYFNPDSRMKLADQVQSCYLAERVYPGKPLIILGDTDWKEVGAAFNWRPFMRQLPALSSPEVISGVAHSLVGSANHYLE